MDILRFVEWNEISKQLKALKTKESSMRKELCEEIFKGRVGNFKEKIELDGFLITAKSKTSTKLDESVLNSVWEKLTPVEKAAIKFKPDLVAKKLKDLDENCLLMQAITEKPAMPTLKIE